MHRPIALAASLTLALVSCKRNVPEEPAPPPAASARAPTVYRCPEIPEWAAKPDTPEQLLAELVYIPEKLEADRKGTGMRVYQSGLVVVWDELEIKMVDGQMKTERKPGAWLPEPVRATPEQLKKLEDALAAMDPATVTDMQGKEKHKAMNFVSGRTKAGYSRGCYRGMTGNDPQGKIEEGVRQIVGAVKEAAKKAKPAASK